MGFMDTVHAAPQEGWRLAAGPLATAAMALTLDLFSRLVGPIPEPTAFILFAVIASAFLGGLRAGLAAAAVAWMYYAWHFSRPGQPFRYDPRDLQRLAVLALATPAMAALVGVLHRRGTRHVSQQLQASEERFKAFMDRIPAAAWMKDVDGRYVYVNQRLCEMLNQDPKKILGKTDYDVNPKSLADKYRRDDQWVMSHLKTFEAVEEFKTQRRKIKIRIHKTPVYDATGRVIGVQGVFSPVEPEARPR